MARTRDHRLENTALSDRSVPMAASWEVQDSRWKEPEKHCTAGVVWFTPRGSQERMSKYLSEELRAVASSTALGSVAALTTVRM